MPALIDSPTTVEAAGNKPKIIQEYVGRVNSNTAEVSVAHVRSPSGWEEPAQTPQFGEYTLVLEGALGAEYIAVCLPAFSPDMVNREVG